MDKANPTSMSLQIFAVLPYPCFAEMVDKTSVSKALFLKSLLKSEVMADWKISFSAMRTEDFEDVNPLFCVKICYSAILENWILA